MQTHLHIVRIGCLLTRWKGEKHPVLLPALAVYLYQYCFNFHFRVAFLMADLKQKPQSANIQEGPAILKFKKRESECSAGLTNCLSLQKIQLIYQSLHVSRGTPSPPPPPRESQTILLGYFMSKKRLDDVNSLLYGYEPFFKNSKAVSAHSENLFLPG